MLEPACEQRESDEARFQQKGANEERVDKGFHTRRFSELVFLQSSNFVPSATDKVMDSPFWRMDHRGKRTSTIVLPSGAVTGINSGWPNMSRDHGEQLTICIMAEAIVEGEDSNTETGARITH